MSKPWSPFYAAALGWFTRVSLMSLGRQGIALIAPLLLVVLLIGWICSAPMLRQSADLDVQIAQTRQVSLEAEQHRRDWAQPSNVPWQNALGRYLPWHEQQVKTKWLSSLTDLGSQHQLRTVSLETADSRIWHAKAELGQLAALGALRDLVPKFMQQVYIWQFEGALPDVFAMLDRLASVAITLDKLAITPTHLAEQAQQTNVNAGNEVMAELTFRVFLKRVEPVSAADQFFTLPRAAAKDWPLLAAVQSVGTGLAVSCRSALAANNADGAVQHIFADDHMPAITFVGVMEVGAGEVAEPSQHGATNLHGVFRNTQGVLRTAAAEAKVSAQEYRLALLDSQRAVLQPPLQSVATKNQAKPVVLMLRPPPALSPFLVSAPSVSAPSVAAKRQQ